MLNVDPRYVCAQKCWLNDRTEPNRSHNRLVCTKLLRARFCWLAHRTNRSIYIFCFRYATQCCALLFVFPFPPDSCDWFALAEPANIIFIAFLISAKSRLAVFFSFLRSCIYCLYLCATQTKKKNKRNSAN